MKDNKLNLIIVITNLIVTVVVIGMLLMTSTKIKAMQEELLEVRGEVVTIQTELQKAEEKAKKEEAVTEQSIAETESQSGAVESTENVNSTDTESGTPTESATDSVMPQIDYITTVANIPAGTALPEEKIDMMNLAQYFTIHEIIAGDEVYNRIIDRSYVENNGRIDLTDLRYIKLLHRDFEARIKVGELIVNAAIAEDIIDIFMELYRQNYQVNSMHLIDDYWVGDGEKSDTASIDVDNTSAFCFRYVTGSSSNLSNHAYGCAIDLNPRENPYVKVQSDGSMTTYHENAQEYVYNRTSATPHVIDENDLAYQLFTAHGFNWGGSWDNPIDYQHFEKPLYD